MIRHDMDDISDEVFDDIVNPCNEYIINYIKENFLAQKFKNKFYINYPLLILTKSDEVVERLDETFISKGFCFD